MTDSARIRELMLVNLFAVFNERDEERRLKAIADNYTEDVIWTDPDGTTHGHEDMNERAQTLLDGNPDFVFTAAGQIHVWPSTWGAGAAAAVSGYDVALVRDGRIAVLYTLLSAGG
jgi:hypothetical protein